jgi:hypothetical protein
MQNGKHGSLPAFRTEPSNPRLNMLHSNCTAPQSTTQAPRLSTLHKGTSSTSIDFAHHSGLRHAALHALSITNRKRPACCFQPKITQQVIPLAPTDTTPDLLYIPLHEIDLNWFSTTDRKHQTCRFQPKITKPTIPIAPTRTPLDLGRIQLHRITRV